MQRTAEKPEGHALGGEGHLRADGRPRVRVAVLRRHAHGRRGARARGAPHRARARDARGVRARRAARSATPSRCRACCTSSPRSSAWATPRSTSSRIVTHQLGIPPVARRRSRGRRRGVAPGARAGRLRARRTASSKTSSCRWRSACASSRSGAAGNGSSIPTATTCCSPTTF